MRSLCRSVLMPILSLKGQQGLVFEEILIVLTSISSFYCDVDEICALLGYYAV
jgi:hypothetical protein